MRTARTHHLVVLLALVWLGVPAVVQAGAPGGKYAVLVAVRRYNPGGLRPLFYTEADMTDLAKVLQANGYRKENILLMTQTEAAAEGDRFSPQAAHVRQELRLLLRSRSPQDTVLIAFSGHGVQFKSSNEFYFCAADADLSDTRTLVSLSDVYKALEQCPARFKLLLADACRTDPLSQAGRPRGQVELESVTRPQTQTLPGGVAAFFSCSQGQEAF